MTEIDGEVTVDEFFLPAMKEAGYTSFFLPKQNSPAVKYGAPSDGCAIFYRTSKFELRQSPIRTSKLTPECFTAHSAF